MEPAPFTGFVGRRGQGMGWKQAHQETHRAQGLGVALPSGKLHRTPRVGMCARKAGGIHRRHNVLVPCAQAGSNSIYQLFLFPFINTCILIVLVLVKNPPANAGDIRDAGSVPGLGRSPGGGNGNQLQYFFFFPKLKAYLFIHFLIGGK